MKFAVTISRYQNQCVFCKHKDRDTWEVPGGHHEAGEAIEQTAKRELREENGAESFSLNPLCVYSVTEPDQFNGNKTFGMLYYADVFSFDKELYYEIEKISITESLPDNWTYPDIQPMLLHKAEEIGVI